MTPLVMHLQIAVTVNYFLGTGVDVTIGGM